MKTDTIAQLALELTDANFEVEVLQSDMPVLVEFYADWNPPWRGISEETRLELATEYSGRAKVSSLNTGKNKETAVKYGADTIPNVFVFKRGEIIQQFVGLTRKRDLVAALDMALR